MERTIKLQVLYADLRNDLLEELDMAESRIIKPAMQAKDGIQPLKKVIKKRGDRKVRSGQRPLPKLGIDILSLILKSTNPA
jgi:selenocysteine-specific translation elongation factor